MPAAAKRGPADGVQNGGSLRTGRGLPRSLSVIGMLARRVPYRLGAVDNGSAWMGDVVQDRPGMARFPCGVGAQARNEVTGGSNPAANRAASIDACGTGLGTPLGALGWEAG